MNLHTCHRWWEPKDGGWNLWATPHCDECCARALTSGDDGNPPPWQPEEIAKVIATLEARGGALDFTQPFVTPTAEIRARVDRIVRTLPFRLSAFGLAMTLGERR